MGNLGNVAYSLLNVRNHQRMIQECCEGITNSTDYESRVKYLNRAYRITKNIAENYMFGGKVISLYYKVIDSVVDCECSLSDLYICNPRAVYVYDPFFIEGFTEKFNSESELLDYLVYIERTRLLNSLNDGKVSKTFNNLDLTNECYNASSDFEKLCHSYGIECYAIKINPAFSERFSLFGGYGFHFFNMVYLNGKSYIVDCTYKQFFKTENNLIERLGVMGLKGCDPGIYMMMGESRRNTALGLLRKGWIPATPEHLKNYLDGFTLSYRNGLYFEEKGIDRYDVSYTLEDYERFLYGDDDMYEYEDIRCLGEQQEPLLNKKIKF